MKILLEKQAEPNATDEWGSGSALHYAIWCGQLEVVKLLLDTGACNIEADTGIAQAKLHNQLLRLVSGYLHIS